MEKLNNPSEFSLIFKYALKDLSRNYHKISEIFQNFLKFSFKILKKAAAGA